MKLLHLGSGGRYYEGYINSDKSPRNHRGDEIKIDEVLELSKPWPHESESVDGIVSMHVMQQLTWRQLLVAFNEALRVLKKGAPMRMGVVAVELEDRSLEYLLGWNNINLFNVDLLKSVLKRIGFSSVEQCEYKKGSMPELYRVDNKVGKTIYIEAIK